jgi:hypothetical protein
MSAPAAADELAGKGAGAGGEGASAGARAAAVAASRPVVSIRRLEEADHEECMRVMRLAFDTQLGIPPGAPSRLEGVYYASRAW